LLRYWDIALAERLALVAMDRETTVSEEGVLPHL
jgi:hypothetical protein